MLERTTLLAVACIVSLMPNIATAQGSCTLPIEPLAAKKSVALGIFNAITAGLESPAKRARYNITIHDGGVSWSIYESLKGGDSVRMFTDAHGVQMETVHDTLGGGGLEMSINKCTAAVSGVHYEK